MKLKLDIVQAFGMGYVAVDLVNPQVLRMRAKDSLPVISAAQNVTRSAYLDELEGVADVVAKFPDFTLHSSIQVTSNGQETHFEEATLGQLFADQPLADYVEAMRLYHHEEGEHVASLRAWSSTEGQSRPELNLSETLQTRLRDLADVGLLYQQVFNRLLAQHLQHVLLDSFPPTVKLFNNGVLKVSEGGAESDGGQGEFTIHQYNILVESESPVDGTNRVFPVKMLELELAATSTKRGVEEYAAEFRGI